MPGKTTQTGGITPPARGDLNQRLAECSQGTWSPPGSFPEWQSGAIVWPDGCRVHLSVRRQDDYILDGLFAEPEGQGTGTHVLNQLKDLARQEGCRVIVEAIENPEYFLSQGFKWAEDGERMIWAP
jgi:GNAT superfamily N-acetyltransferase